MRSAQPVKAAVRRSTGKVERFERTRAGTRGARRLERNRLAAKIGLNVAEVILEHGNRRRSEAKMSECGIPAADAELRASARLGLKRCDRRRRYRSVARQWIGHSCAEADVRGRLRRKRERHVAVTRKVLRVDDRKAIEARAFGSLCLARSKLRKAKAESPDLGTHAPGLSGLRGHDEAGRRPPAHTDLGSEKSYVSTSGQVSSIS